MKTLGIYVHIPFCKKKCRYCDFYSIVSNDPMRALYVDALLTELGGYEKEVGGYIIDTIYIGGGTPSMISPEHLRKLFSGLKRFDIADGCEITMEVNPGTIDNMKVQTMKEVGVNRVSIGAQSFCDPELEFLGRIHRAKDIKNTFRMFRKRGFGNISLDILFAFPTETKDSFRRTLDEALSLSPEHISAYPLKIEEDTEFGRMLKNGLLDKFDEEIDREMYSYAKKTLAAKGYEHYEISSFSKPGHASRHNLRYWDLSEYIGIGASAHSFFDSKRWRNWNDIYGYITEPSIKEDITVYDVDALAREYMMLGFRRIQGVSRAMFKSRFGFEMDERFESEISDLVKRRLLSDDGGSVKLTEKGLDFANQVFMEFI